MDPLSITASVIAVLQAASAIVSISYDYTCALKGARWGLSNFTEEVRDLRNVLETLAQFATKAESGHPDAEIQLPTLRLLCQPCGPLDIGLSRLEALEKRLAPSNWSDQVRSRRRVFIQALSWPLREAETKRAIDEIGRLKTTLNLAMAADQAALMLEIRDMALTTRETAFDAREDIAKLYQLSTSKNIDARREKIHRWLSAPDPSLNHNAARKKRQADTGSWFIKSKEFYEWKISPDTVLWLYGIPGCGKTILSSTIIDDILHFCHLRQKSAAAYFYFDFNDITKQSPENMLRSLVAQLSVRTESTPQGLESLFSLKMEGKQQPMIKELLTILQQTISEFEGAFIVLDALDECGQRQDLLDVIEEIAAWNTGNLHIIITSRREQDIEDSFRTLSRGNRVSIQNAEVNKDIRLYVRERLQTDRKLKRWRKKPEVQQEIAEALMDKADGMFRWAACQLDALENCLNLPMLRKALASLPKTLDDTYAQALCRIEEEHAEGALKMLQWLTYSTRPLYIEELAEVVTIDIKSRKRFEPERRFPEPWDILTLCPSLLVATVEGSHSDSYEGSDDHIAQQQVKLAHFSVKEYLLSQRIQTGPSSQYAIRETRANASIAEDCLAYLLQFDRPYFAMPSVVRDSPLLRYATNHWPKHTRMAGSDIGTVHQLIMELFQSEQAYLNWVAFFDGYTSFDSDDLTIDGDQSSSLRVPAPLYYASSFGLVEVSRLLLDNGADINAQGGPAGCALVVASLSGHCEVVQLLLERGADIEASGGLLGNALSLASDNGHRQIVQLLLERGADVNAKGASIETALQ